MGQNIKNRLDHADASPGLDITFTKVVLDFQAAAADALSEPLNGALTVLRETFAVDAISVVNLDDNGRKLVTHQAAKADDSQIDLALFGPRPFAGFPWLSSRLGHLRVLEMLDARFVGESMEADARHLTAHGVGAGLFAGFHVDGQLRGFVALLSAEPRAGWDVSLHLLLKIVAASIANGLGRSHAERELRNERRRSELATLSANEGLWDYDVINDNIWFSPRWKRMLGYDEVDSSELNLDWHQLIHPDDLSRVQGLLRDHIANDAPAFESIHRMRHRNGEWRWVLSRAKATIGDDGTAERIVGVELDITERKFFEEALRREKERAHITLQSIGDGVISTDANGHIEYLNPTASELTGWKLDDAAGRPVNDVFRTYHEETCEPLEDPLAVATRSPRPVKSLRPTLLIRRDGAEMYVESTASAIRDEQGRYLGGVLVFHDVSEARDLHRRLSYHTSHDMLTGLVNRAELEKQLERALKSAADNDAHYAFCHIDIDQFKMVNDTCGHTAGDTLLAQLGQLLKSKIRWRDTLARLGGDEFGLLLESCALDEAVDMAETLREVVEGFRFTWDDRTFRLGASVGVVPLSPGIHDVAGLLSSADSACAAAKESGRNRIHVFQDNDIDLMRRRREMQWAARINNALEENRFELFNQVIRPLRANETGEHYEMLLRLRDEGGKLIPPSEFISAAERYNLMPSIDRWVVRQSFAWLLSSDDHRKNLAVCAINLSGQSLADDKFTPFVTHQLESSGIDPHKICFEITETAAIASYSKAKEFIHAMKELGCRFALDDFGTGMSSFGYLKQFPVDYLKIDGSFVRGILNDPIDREMVRSINEIGHLTGKQTIAEFAENDDILAMLASMGVDFAQGYAVSEPKKLVRAA
ncbi:MAG: EAL domain-containing protein [Gammaproteobacteria bacterium]|nr:EAL domain-containing protein [Gammaproteobacteria bacterium]NND59147.1 EAL domain-containing protein [Gammaproteobacteria bacterium]